MDNILKIVKKLYSNTLSQIHTILLRNKRTRIGKNSLVYFRSNIFNKGTVVIGNNTSFGGGVPSHVAMPFFSTIFVDNIQGTVRIGNNCRINGAYIHSKLSICIGNNCVIANNVNIIDSNGHETKSFDRTIGRDVPQEIIIGDNVWIGMNSVILKGTTIGNNSIVSAGSIVKGSYPANSIISNGTAKTVYTWE